MKYVLKAFQADVIQRWISELRRWFRRNDDDDIFGSPFAIL
ncbi:MAG: hypothetical protein V4717_00040 [Bacteroidota bacterium]